MSLPKCLPGDEVHWCPTCHKMTPHRYRPSPEAGPYWRCSECGAPNKAMAARDRLIDAARGR